jgi:hypothetical protein
VFAVPADGARAAVLPVRAFATKLDAVQTRPAHLGRDRLIVHAGDRADATATEIRLSPVKRLAVKRPKVCLQ